MDPNSTSTLENLQRQLETILVLLDRPIVQLQIGALVAALIVGWVISWLIGRLFNPPRRPPEEDELTFSKAVRTFLYTTPFPIISLLLVQATIFYFDARDLPFGFLQDGRPLLLIILAYELLLALLYFRYEDQAVSLYHKLVLRPLLTLIIIFLVLNNFLNLNLIRLIPLFTIFDTPITLGTIGEVLLIGYTFGVASYIIQDILKRRMASANLESAAVTSILIVSRYTVIAIGLVLVAAVLGVNASTLAVIGGGLSIGIGFGLQQIVANFISGILLLFEQSLRPGDVIDLNGQLGVVKQVNIRSTTIQTNDNVEIIVPNEQFLINNVTTYTRNARTIRVQIPFGISYSADPKAARDLVIKTVSKHGNVKAKPKPEVQFLGFGDSSLDFRLLVWMDDPIRTPRFRSDLYFMIFDAFERHGIEIPFPQRDLHIRSGLEQLLKATPTTDAEKAAPNDDPSTVENENEAEKSR